MRKVVLDICLGVVLAGVALAVSACVTSADLTCHYKVGVGYVCDGGLGGPADNTVNM